MPEKQPSKASRHGRADVLVQKYISQPYLGNIVRSALEEDLGSGDLTSCIFNDRDRGTAVLLAKADGILSGSALVNTVFRQLNRSVKVNWHLLDGGQFHKGDILATISGSMKALLQGERVSLNFLQHMCGIATLTEKYVAAVGKGKGRPGIFDTRKTTPLQRAFEKKAVTDGGGQNHRYALYDMAMLKNNHIDAAGSISEAVEKLVADGFYKNRPGTGLCVEARTLEEAVEATWCGADIIMLDNMSPASIKKAAGAVKREAGLLKMVVPELEISDGITLKNLGRYASLPVQRISIGALTHSAPALDISMRFTE